MKERLLIRLAVPRAISGLYDEGELVVSGVSTDDFKT